jgi:serine/threonine protein kinase
MKTPKAIARFEREMRAVGRLDHANIVRALHAGEDGDTPYLVVEYVDGLNLADLVARLGVLPIADACELVRQAAAVGLQHAYENGLVHRDIKPSNLMLTRDGTLKILDLGLALLQTDAPHGAEMTGAGTAMGTADYMAPEQVTDSHSVDIRSDLYSLGCTLYKLLSGRAPFVGPEYKNEMTKMMAHVQQTPRPITSLRTDVPPDLAAVVERMMAKDPGQRYATPADVAAALASFAVGANLRSLLSDALRKTEPPAPSLEPRIDTDQMAAGPVVDTATSAATPAPQLAPALPCSRTDFQSVQATTQPVPQVAAAAARGRRWNSRAVGMLTLATGFAFVVLGVIAVRIRDKIGRETVIRVPIADLCFRPVAD